MDSENSTAKTWIFIILVIVIAVLSFYYRKQIMHIARETLKPMQTAIKGAQKESKKTFGTKLK